MGASQPRSRYRCVLIGLVFLSSLAYGQSAKPQNAPDNPQTMDVSDALNLAITTFNDGDLRRAADLLEDILRGHHGGLSGKGFHLGGSLLIESLARTERPDEAAEWGAALYRTIPRAFRPIGDLSTQPTDAIRMDLRNSIMLLGLVKSYHDSHIYLHNASDRRLSLSRADTDYHIQASINADDMTLEGAAGQGPLEFYSTTAGDTLVIESGAGVILRSLAIEDTGDSIITYSSSSTGESSISGLDKFIPDFVAILSDLGQETLPEDWLRLSSGVFMYQVHTFQVTSKVKWGDSEWFDVSLIDYQKTR